MARLKFSEWDGKVLPDPKDAPIELLRFVRAFGELFTVKHAPPDARQNPLLKTWFLESDRGVVLICHTMLDEALETAIASRFKLGTSEHDTKIYSVLFRGGTAPMQSSWLRSRMAYALGLIDAEMLAALDETNDLRNKMAHPRGKRDIEASEVERIASKLPDRLRRKYVRSEQALRPFIGRSAARKKRLPQIIESMTGTEVDAKTAAQFVMATMQSPSDGACLFLLAASLMAGDILRKVRRKTGVNPSI